MWRHREDPRAGELIAETEAFLTGSFADHLIALGQPVPLWAWLNVLAHGSEADLCRVSCSRTPGGDWHRARAFLAGEVLDHLEAGTCSLTDLQRDILIGLELEVAAIRSPLGWGPGQLVVAVLAVLPERARWRRH